MEAIGQEWDEVAEHMAGARKAMKEEEFRGMRCTRLTIEDVEAVYVGGAVLGAGHGVSLPIRSLTKGSPPNKSTKLPANGSPARPKAPRARAVFGFQRLTPAWPVWVIFPRAG